MSGYGISNPDVNPENTRPPTHKHSISGSGNTCTLYRTVSELIVIKVFERLSTLLMGSIDGLMMSAACWLKSI